MKKWLCILLLLCRLCPAVAAVQPAAGSNTAVVLCETLSLCAAREGKAVATLRYGDQLTVLESWDGWARCKVNGREGWVRSDYLLVDPAWYVTDEQTAVYAYGDTFAPRVALLDKGTRLPILLNSGEWLVISLRGAAGWVRKTPADTVHETYFRPAMLQNITSAALFVNGKAADLRDRSKLAELSGLLTSAEDKGAPVAGCPFTATLNVTTADGQSYSLELVTDSCCVYRIDNRDYAYARHLLSPEGSPQNSVLFELFGISWPQ